MEVGAFQGELGAAIAQLESIKERLLETFAWGSHPKMTTDQERQYHAMNIVSVQTEFPLIDTRLSNAFQMITGNPLPFHITTKARAK